MRAGGMDSQIPRRLGMTDLGCEGQTGGERKNDRRLLTGPWARILARVGLVLTPAGQPLLRLVIPSLQGI